MERILITGAFGLLGCTLSAVLEQKDHNILRHSFTKKSEYQSDLTEYNAAFDLLNQVQPGIIINLVGLTNVDECEINPNKAYLLNTRVVENICAWMCASKSEVHLIHISTDQVYDGNGPHTEDQITISNYYGLSKYAGELVALGVSSTIVRTNFFGKSKCADRSSFTDWIYSSLNYGETITVFDDVFFSALSMSTLSSNISDLIHKKPKGIFNLGADTGVSKADFSFMFAEELGLPTKLMKRASIDSINHLKAIRPKNMIMDCGKIKKACSFSLPDIKYEIIKSAREYI